MLGCIRSMAVTASQVLCLVAMMGKAAVTPVSSIAAWGALFACSRHQNLETHESAARHLTYCVSYKLGKEQPQCCEPCMVAACSTHVLPPKMQ